MVILTLYDQKKWFLDWTLIFFWTASLLILLFSFHQQYVAEIEPCRMCKWQRYIYFLVSALSPFGLIQRFNMYVRNVLSFIFFIGFCLSTYHALVQFGWLTDRCTMTRIENIVDFMKMLEHPKTSCATIGWKLFGLSASIYNSIFSLCSLIVLTLKTLKRLSYV